MSRKLKLSVGQKVIIRYMNDKIRYIKDTSTNNIDEWTTTGKITKIGRRYIYVDVGKIFKHTKFSIDNNYEEEKDWGSPNYKIYLSKEEIIKSIQAESLYSTIKNMFSSWHNNDNFTLSQLKKIVNIANENNKI